ncbi:MAG: HlyD family efflux transporter periplasmic adaptor subunit [Mariniblastus sp.]|nr:HlyD family efflux transporter periplasmic adaptor subunit [Mariniblastus sp.]
MRLILCLFITFGCGAAFGSPQETPTEVPDKVTSETVVAEVRPLVVYETLEGVVEASNTAEVELESNGWTDFELETLVPQGKRVNKGDLVVSFQSEGIEKAYRSLEFEHRQRVADLAVQKLKTEQAIQKYELAVAIAKREMENASEDHQYYLDVERPQRLKDLEWSLKTSEYSLEYAREELDQLMQMYNEDELTEESEKIVLKRAQRGLESAERNLARRKMSIQQTRDVDIPRDDFSKKNALEQKSLSFALTMLELPFEKDKSETDLLKAEMVVRDSNKKLEELGSDRKLMAMAAPMTGIVYYGRCVKGKWTGVTGTSTRSLEIGKKVPSNKVVMTIIDPASLVIRTMIPEDKLYLIRPGMVGVGVLKSDPQVKLDATVTSVGTIPSASGTFECLLSLKDFANEGEKVMPGMHCKVAMKVSEKEAAVMIPKGSVYSDDGIQQFVTLPGGQPRKVELGFDKGDSVEVVGGLKAGEKILKTPR